MENKTRAPLTPLDVGTLMACEAVSMLDAAPDTLDSAAGLRSALTAFAIIRGLGKDGGALLAWVDEEIDSAKRFAESGERVETSTWRKAAAAIMRDCDSDPQRHELLMKLRNCVPCRFRQMLSETPKGMDAPPNRSRSKSTLSRNRTRVSPRPPD